MFKNMNGISEVDNDCDVDRYSGTPHERLP
jgi:hypothetical protein